MAGPITLIEPPPNFVPGNLAVAGAITAGGNIIGDELVEGALLRASGSTGDTTNPLTIGGQTATGHPTTGVHSKGELIVAEDGGIWLCTVTGTPGTWIQLNGSGGGALGWQNYIYDGSMDGSGNLKWTNSDGLPGGFDYSDGVGSGFSVIHFPVDSITTVTTNVIFDVILGAGQANLAMSYNASVAGQLTPYAQKTPLQGTANQDDSLTITYVFDSVALVGQTLGLNVLVANNVGILAATMLSLISVAHP